MYKKSGVQLWLTTRTISTYLNGLGELRKMQEIAETGRGDEWGGGGWVMSMDMRDMTEYENSAQICEFDQGTVGWTETAS